MAEIVAIELQRIKELEGELAWYHALFADVCRLEAARNAVEALKEHESEQAQDTWDEFNDALDDVCDYVADMRHADAMDAADVTCNELHHMSVVLSA